MDKKIIERIKKMFTLANDKGASLGEAENAFRMANKLMEKHNLSSMDLHNKEDLIFKFEDGSIHSWVNTLYSSISELYSCYTFRQGKHQRLIIGTESDCTTVSIIVHGLIDSIKNAGKNKGIAFKNGASFEIADQCNTIIEERRENTEIHAGSGLVLADIYDSKFSRSEEFAKSLVKYQKKKEKQFIILKKVEIMAKN